MDNLVCTECGATYYSAAARTMIARGERCECGAHLRLVREDTEVPVGGPPERETNGGGGAKAAPSKVRRFTRD